MLQQTIGASGNLTNEHITKKRKNVTLADINHKVKKSKKTSGSAKEEAVAVANIRRFLQRERDSAAESESPPQNYLLHVGSLSPKLLTNYSSVWGHSSFVRVNLQFYQDIVRLEFLSSGVHQASVSQILMDLPQVGQGLQDLLEEFSPIMEDTVASDDPSDSKVRTWTFPSEQFVKATNTYLKSSSSAHLFISNKEDPQAIFVSDSSVYCFSLHTSATEIPLRPSVALLCHAKKFITVKASDLSKALSKITGDTAKFDFTIGNDWTIVKKSEEDTLHIHGKIEHRGIVQATEGSVVAEEDTDAVPSIKDISSALTRDHASRLLHERDKTFHLSRFIMQELVSFLAKNNTEQVNVCLCEKKEGEDQFSHPLIYQSGNPQSGSMFIGLCAQSIASDLDF